MTLVSADCGDIFSRRPSSLSAFSATFSGMPDSRILLVYSSTSAWTSSNWPSSCWIALSCSRRKYSRCDLVICSLTRSWILVPSSRISSSFCRKRVAASRRSRGSSESRMICFSSTLRLRWNATKSPRRPGSSIADAATSTSCGIGLPSSAACSKSPTRARMSAWVSMSVSVDSSMSSTRTRKYGSSSMYSTMRMRCWPSTSALAVPSGSLSSCMTDTDAADVVEVLGPGSWVSALLLGDERDVVALAHRLLERLDRLLATDEQRHDEVREHDEVPQRNQWQHVGDDRALVSL